MSAAADRRILDLTHLARQTFGDPALEREVLALFEQQCIRLLPLILVGEDLTERGTPPIAQRRGPGGRRLAPGLALRRRSRRPSTTAARPRPSLG